MKYARSLTTKAYSIYKLMKFNFWNRITKRTYDEIQEQVIVRSRRIISKYIKELKEKGFVVKVKKGIYKIKPFRKVNYQEKRRGYYVI